ncbi:hypothetical protein I3F58_02845 [Streptomyces sp. MUM 203J]|uniref:hypothetical protein n=1 Tax=Streptomyces sp. MUM 203J TaxID=2791990 RepID=UPI001F0444D9|nr:hypothetical protein [Streptomyces sp. MUM 203J]MCH0538512.1 hypothetical protein [Streptomyces sp. MUM 203J]
MHPQDAPSAHRTTTTERGAFALARCTCGWTGPARRSRERARTDATAHETAAASTA